MLSGDMLGTTWGDEEGTVPPEPQFAKLCELGRDTPFANETPFVTLPREGEGVPTLPHYVK